MSGDESMTWWLGWYVRLRPVRLAVTATIAGQMTMNEDGTITIRGTATRESQAA